MKPKHKKKSKKNSLFTCVNPNCNYVFFDTSSLITHYKNNSLCYNFNSYNCNSCGIPFTNKKSLQHHQLMKPECMRSYDINKNVEFGQIPKLFQFKTHPLSSNKKRSRDCFMNSSVSTHHISTVKHPDTTITTTSNINQSNSDNNISIRNLISSHNIFSNTKNISNFNNSKLSSSKSTNENNNNDDFFSFDECISLSSTSSKDSNTKSMSRCSNIVQDNNMENICDNNSFQCLPTFISDYKPEIKNYNDVRKLQNSMLRHKEITKLEPHSIVMMDLFLILKTCNAPLNLFDKIINFLQTHQKTLKDEYYSSCLRQRKLFIEKLLNQTCEFDKTFFSPRTNQMTLSSKRRTTITTFSLRDFLTKTISNTLLFKKEHLLINPLDPCTLISNHDYYSDINTGDHYINSWKHIQSNHFTKNNDNNVLPCPLIYFIDGLTIDKFGKKSLEAVLCCFGLFKREIRNRESSWFVQGFVEDQNSFLSGHVQGFLEDQGSNCVEEKYPSFEKLQDYHDMLQNIFSELKYIHDNGGIYCSLNIPGFESKDVYLVPFIQFVIGDCKGNDALCGRKASHSLQMNCLSRDCNVLSENATDTCCDIIGLDCHFFTSKDFVNKSKDDLKKISFHPLNNCFLALPFGGCSRNIWGSTPIELLHGVELGLCNYIHESYEIIFTETERQIISNTATNIFTNNYRQSERQFPILNHFRNGISAYKNLKAVERFARCVAIYIALNNSYCISALISWRKQKNKKEPFTVHFLKNFTFTIEQTIIFHQWLKEGIYKKDDITSLNPNTNDSKAMLRIKKYLSQFKKYIRRKGNGLSTPKFHQNLHIPDYIRRFGCPSNFDGSIGEQKGKFIVKNNALRTNKQEKTLCNDVCRRIFEQNVVDDASLIYYNNTGRFPSEYCNDMDILEITSERTNTHKNTICKCTYSYTVHISDDESGNYNYKSDNIDTSLHIKIGIQWKKPNVYKHIDLDLMTNVITRLFIQTENNNFYGKIDYKKSPSINGITSFTYNNTLYRCDPCFQGKPWYDWVYICWEGYDDPIPCQLKVVLDLSNVDLIFDDSANSNHRGNHHKLSKEKWIIVSSCKSFDESIYQKLSDHCFDSKIHKRFFKMDDDDDIWIVPLRNIHGPCYVVENKNYVSQYIKKDTNMNEKEESNTVYVIKSMDKWGKEFLE